MAPYWNERLALGAVPSEDKLPLSVAPLVVIAEAALVATAGALKADVVNVWSVP